MGVVLHNHSRFDVGGWGILGSPTRLLERGSSSESLSSGSVNHPLHWAVVVSGSCVQRWSKGSFKLNLCYDLAGFRGKAKSVVRLVQVLSLLVLGVPLFKAEDVRVRLVNYSIARFS